MSRNAEYQFVSTDTAELVSLIVAMYEKITGQTVQPGSPERLFIQWVGNVIVQERVLNNYTGNQNIPCRAEGANLDALGNCTEPGHGLRPRRLPAGCASLSPRPRPRLS